MKTIRNAAGNKDKHIADLIDGARKIRTSIQQFYKDFLRMGKKVKHLEPVGSLVAEAINEMIEAEMALKAVVDAGTDWASARVGSGHRAYNPYNEEGALEPAYELLDGLQKSMSGMLSNRKGWWFKKRGGSVIFQVFKPNYTSPERGVLKELQIDIDTSFLVRNGTFVVRPVWEETDTIELKDWTKAARSMNQADRMSKVVKDTFDKFEQKNNVTVSDWVFKNFFNYVMKNAWESEINGKSMRGFRYDI